ncbi:MAG: glycoside hydrolase family 3 C-terminal domain-containing protein [Bacteroidaceae bacterium]|nr:glycoside hydrolase family 3 C-terminal domain-containing protein [Bacteroidaceae bacterium]
MKKTAFLALAVMVSALSYAGTPQSRLTANDKKINAIIAKMTLEEKVQMLHSKTIMSSEGVPSQGIQEIRYADGPFGIRDEVGDGFRPMNWTTDSATYFPTGSALAATWSPELAYRYGHGMGVEGRKRGKDVILGPAINIQRLPVGGRTYEYLSEDPFLAAALAVEYTKGSQDAGTAVCVKHFALNNQETNRGSVNVIADERTMRELYLKPFEAAVTKGGAMVVMPAYNKVNGYYCSENNHLLNEILRGDWGFKGFTVSDWGGTHSTVGAAMGGLNVQMTGDNYFGKALIDSVNAGIVPMSVIDSKVRELLRVRFAIKAVPADVANQSTASQPESRRTAYDVATKSVVLLKNEGGVLPIKPSVKKIAVIGHNAVALTARGGVGAGVKAPYEITPLQGIQNRAGNVTVTYAEGYTLPQTGGWGRQQAAAPSMDLDLMVQAIKAASEADMVIYVCGTSKSIETEGSDRSDIKLPLGQEELIAAISAVNPNIATVIISGGPCDLQKLDKYSPAIVQGWWNGLEGGNALADILFGKIAPSGKLPFTFPIRLEDSPAYAMGNFPQRSTASAGNGDLFTNMYRQDLGGNRNAARTNTVPDAEYSEKLLVGYRWFDTKEKPVMYAFGHGLSYVDFNYGTAKANKSSYKAKDVIKVTFNLTNEGTMEADEVAQLYVHYTDSKIERPYKELKAFKRVTVGAGQTAQVTLEVPVMELRYWDESVNGWVLEGGSIELMIGSASDDIRQSVTVNI